MSVRALSELNSAIGSSGASTSSIGFMSFLTLLMLTFNIRGAQVYTNHTSIRTDNLAFDPFTTVSSIWFLPWICLLSNHRFYLQGKMDCHSTEVLQKCLVSNRLIAWLLDKTSWHVFWGHQRSFQEKEVKLLAVQVSCSLDTKDQQVLFQMPSPMEILHQK